MDQNQSVPPLTQDIGRNENLQLHPTNPVMSVNEDEPSTSTSNQNQTVEEKVSEFFPYHSKF